MKSILNITTAIALIFGASLAHAQTVGSNATASVTSTGNNGAYFSNNGGENEQGENEKGDHEGHGEGGHGGEGGEGGHGGGEGGEGGEGGHGGSGDSD